VSSSYLDSLFLMSMRPSALPVAERMTLDLVRLYCQNLLASKKYKLTKLVCDFVEDQTGRVYFL